MCVDRTRTETLACNAFQIKKRPWKLNHRSEFTPKLSTGLRDGAFRIVCMYRSDGERMTSSPRGWAKKTAIDIYRLQPTSFKGCTKWSDSILRVSILTSFLALGFSSTMDNEDPRLEELCPTVKALAEASINVKADTVNFMASYLWTKTNDADTSTWVIQ